MINTENKIFVVLIVLVFAVGISYSVFSWSEPSEVMPSEYKTPVNTSSENQDVDTNKPKVGNFDSDKLDGYDSSDLLAASSESSCPDNYANVCANGGGLEFEYNGQILHIDAYPRRLINDSDDNGMIGAAWESCQAIGARIPTVEEWQSACNSLSGINGDGMNTFGGGYAGRYEITATPSVTTEIKGIVFVGNNSCSATAECGDFTNGAVYAPGSVLLGYGSWFRCIR